MTTYQLSFTLDQVNELIACMANGPYARVNGLIQEIQRQINAQVQPPPVPPLPMMPSSAPANGGTP